MQLEVVAGMAGLVVGEVEEADPAGITFVPTCTSCANSRALRIAVRSRAAERAGGDGWDIIAAAKTATS